MLILVVGPSGAGKDTVLGLARQALHNDPRFRFVRRVITRPANGGAEDHEAVTPVEFERRDFALQWRAHGLDYGIPVDVIDDLARGIVAIANVSRAVVAVAAERFPARVIEVTAPPEILARRLAARGRETAADVAGRLARDIKLPDTIPVETIVNDATPAQAAQRLIAALIRAAPPVQRS